MQGGEVDLLFGIPGKKPPPPYVAPPYALCWFPITPSIVVRIAVQETAGFQDGSVPGATVVLWADNGCAASKTDEPTSAASIIAHAVAFARF